MNERPSNSESTPLVAVVTGAGRGIGRAIAERLASEGYRLELCNLDPAELAETCAALGSSVVGHRAFDLADREATDAWLADLGQRHEVIDVLINNAGVGGPDPENDGDAMAHLDQVLEVNAGALHRIARHLAPRSKPEAGHATLRVGGRGRIVVVASVLGRMGVPGFGIYGASKAAAIGLVRAMACDLARFRITVNAVCPGWTDTAMATQGFEAIAAENDTSPESARAGVEKGLPLGRIVEPEEIASLVAWLASADAGAMSGQALTMAAGDFQA